MSERQVIVSLKIKLDLMVGASQGGEWNTVPTAAYWAMNMAKKEVLDIGKIFHDLIDSHCIFSKANFIDCWNTDIKRRVMHKEINWLIFVEFQLRL